MLSTLGLLMMMAMGNIVVTTARQTWQQCLDNIKRTGRHPNLDDDYDVRKEIFGQQWFLKAISLEGLPKGKYFAFLRPHKPSIGFVQEIGSEVDFHNGNYRCNTNQLKMNCSGAECTGYLANGTKEYTSYVLATDYVSTYIYYGSQQGFSSIGVFVTDPGKQPNMALLNEVAFNVCGGNNAPLASSIKIIDVPEAVVLAHTSCLHYEA